MNRKGVANRNGMNACFSWRYRPGAMNIHICPAIIGKVKQKEVNKATFIWVKNHSWGAVKIIRRPSRLSPQEDINGCARKL